MVPSFKQLKYLARDYGSAQGIIHQQKPIPELPSFPSRGIIMEVKREGATTEERIVAIAEAAQRE